MKIGISDKGFTPTPIANNMRKLKLVWGFTFIELLMTLAIIAICFLPLMRMFSAALEASYSSNDLTIARYLAQEGMEKVKNLGFTESQLRALGDIWEPPLTEKPFEINKRKWRTLRKIVPESDPLQVQIQVHLVSGLQAIKDSDKPFVELVTLIEDLDWTTIE